MYLNILNKLIKQYKCLADDPLNSQDEYDYARELFAEYEGFRLSGSEAGYFIQRLSAISVINLRDLIHLGCISNNYPNQHIKFLLRECYVDCLNRREIEKVIQAKLDDMLNYVP
jgi:hypothetical protein